MNPIQSVGASTMAWGCALPVCFAPGAEHINTIGMFIFIVGVIILIFGSETGYTIEKVLQ